ncbi:hypothetical protein [Phycicoccus sp. Soil748]|uniref:hypothetical protein n=1 Tax=Phycicoccus sp. Soil748 TaxID=1736397 RepID=UPI0012E3D165|nr:hypothetical protein [Phycicoccus sp. Soil748]
MVDKFAHLGSEIERVAIKGLDESTGERFRSKVPRLLAELGVDSESNVNPVFRSRDYSVYQLEIDDGRGRYDVTLTEDRHGIHLETPLAQIPEESGPTNAYKSILEYNHDLAIGHLTVGPVAVEGQSREDEREGIYYGMHVPKVGVPYSALRAELTAYGDSVPDVARQVMKRSAADDLDLLPLVDLERTHQPVASSEKAFLPAIEKLRTRR